MSIMVFNKKKLKMYIYGQEIVQRIVEKRGDVTETKNTERAHTQALDLNIKDCKTIQTCK